MTQIRSERALKKEVDFKAQKKGVIQMQVGGPEGIRTLGHSIKSRTLYLAELQAPTKPEDSFLVDKGVVYATKYLKGQ